MLAEAVLRQLVRTIAQHIHSS